MKILLVATYELGQQPLGVAGPAAALAAAGHEVAAADLSVDPWPADQLASVDAVVFSVPMHTATELAVAAARRVRETRPQIPLGFVGLYAPVLEGDPLLEPGDLLAAGATGAALVEWVGGERSGVAIDIGAPPPPRNGAAPAHALDPLPARHLLPPLDRYAHMLRGETMRAVRSAAVEASRGCNHTCRHCPVAPIYRGRSRPVPVEAVLADVAQAVALGAEHVSFADPDFLNRPAHARRVVEQMALVHPGVTFDATVKVEHILRHEPVWRELAAAGLVFVVSAFESADDEVLGLLDKGHRVADELEAVRILRDAGIEPRPSWLPFSPWTTLQSLGALLELTARADLVWNTDPVQYSIRLLLPRGSLLLESPDPVLATSLAGTAGLGSTTWHHRDPAIDELQREVAVLVEDASLPAPAVFASVWERVRRAGAQLGMEPPPPDPALASEIPGPERPRSSEAWFCCAEPTVSQLDLVRR